MSSVKSLLLWERWRPKTMDEIILLPRIRKYLESGVTQNFIFYGNYGTGKTSLARILVGKYSKDKPYLELNSSLFTSIDILRTEIEDFCKFIPMMETKSDIKYVILDEVDRVSIQFMDAFKGFIEKYHKNVRFILITNHLNRITPGIMSRFTSINFDCQNLEEEKYLKKELYKKINNIILPKEDKNIPKDDIISIITKKFPDLRSVLVEVQNHIETGGLMTSSSIVSNQIKLDLYSLLYDKSSDYEKIYHFIMSNFGPEKIDVMIKLLGKQFIDWSISEGKNVDKLFECNYIIADYTSKLETNTDPIILGLTIIGKLRDILI